MRCIFSFSFSLSFFLLFTLLFPICRRILVCCFQVYVCVKRGKKGGVEKGGEIYANRNVYTQIEMCECNKSIRWMK